MEEVEPALFHGELKMNVAVQVLMLHLVQALVLHHSHRFRLALERASHLDHEVDVLFLLQGFFQFLHFFKQILPFN